MFPVKIVPCVVNANHSYSQQHFDKKKQKNNKNIFLDTCFREYKAWHFM